MQHRFRIPVVALTSLVIAAALAVAGCGGDDGSASSASTGGGKQLRKVQLLVSNDGGESIFYYPFGLADSLGYFKQEGIDMEFVAGNGGSGVVQQIVSGNVQAGLTSPASILVADSQGHPLKVPFSYVYGPTFDVVVPGDSPVQSMKDLDGKTIGVSEFSGGEVPFVRALMAQNHINAKLVPVGFGLQAVDALKNERVDAYSSGLPDFQQMKSAGYDFRRISPPEVATFPGTGIAISPDAWAKDRDLWVGFLRAAARGQYYGLTHPDQALEIMKKRLPDSFEDRSGEDFFRAMLGATVPPGGKDGPYGVIEKAGWEKYQDFLLAGAKGDDGDVLTKPANIDEIIDSSAVDEINDFPKDAQ